MLFLQLVAWVVLSPETSAQMSPLRRSPSWLSMEDPILTHCQSFLSWLISFTALKKLQGTWMGREVVILSKVGQKEKDKYRMTSLICGTWNLIQMNLSGKQNHRHRKQTWGCRGEVGRGVTDRQFGLSRAKQQGPTVYTGDCIQHSQIHLNGKNLKKPTALILCVDCLFTDDSATRMQATGGQSLYFFCLPFLISDLEQFLAFRRH